MYPYRILEDHHIAPIGEAVLIVLERVGVLCQSEELLAALAAGGAEVDPPRQIARMPRTLTEPLLAQLRREAPPEDREPQRFAPPGQPGLGTQVAQILYDYGTGERQAGDREGLTRCARFGDALHGESGVGHCLLLTDVPPMVEPMEAGLILARHTRRPGPPFAWHVDQVPYLIEMGEILGLPGWYTWGAICFAHPLRFDRDVVARFVARAKLGDPVGLTAMPVAGVTTPITVAGFVTMCAAELVATWIAARAINPHAPFTGSIWGGALDMRTGDVSYSSFDAMFYALAASEFLRRWTGHLIPVGGGAYSSAREPGYYAAMEKAHKAMTIAAFTGQPPSIGSGMLESGRTLCLVQLLLERELTEGVRIYSRDIEVSTATLCLDDILAVEHGLERSFLSTDSVLRDYRQYSWCPPTLERDGWRGAQTDERVLQRLQARVDDLIASHVDPPVDEDRLAAAARVARRARTELL